MVKKWDKIFYVTDNAGIGTINPMSTLDIRGNLAVTGNVILTDTETSIVQHQVL